MDVFFGADIVVDVTGCLTVNRVADLGLDKWLETDASKLVWIIIYWNNVTINEAINMVFLQHPQLSTPIIIKSIMQEVNWNESEEPLSE